MSEIALTMPKMSMTMEEGTINVWLKNVGDPVKNGEPVCEVETDKVSMEVEATHDGVLGRIVAEVDDVVKVGDPIAYITSDEEDLLGGLFDAPAAPAEDASVTGPAPEEAQTRQASAEASSDWPAAVPLARKVAEEMGVNLGTVAPSGPWGTIRVSDVEAAFGQTSAPAAAAPAAPAPVAEVGAPEPEKKKLSPAEVRRRRTRKLVAKRMSASALIPQFTVYRDVDLTALNAVRKTELGGASWTAILLRAQAVALRAYPQLNAFWIDDDLVDNDDIGVALAVDSPNGLIAPVVRNPDRQELSELSGNVRELIEATRTSAITPEMVEGATTVFSNLGGLGVEKFNALITPPHATALSIGSVRNQLVAGADQSMSFRLVCTVGLTVDHRVADGADGARFVEKFAATLTDRHTLVDAD